MKRLIDLLGGAGYVVDCMNYKLGWTDKQRLVIRVGISRHASPEEADLLNQIPPGLDRKWP
jgi:hypothetical protein